MRLIDEVRLAMEILRVNIISLKYFLLWPDDNLSLLGNIIISILHHSIIFMSSVQTLASIIYQLVVGIDDINIIIESVIGMGDYFGFMFIYVCFRVNIPKVKRTIGKFSIFLKYCSASFIQEADEKVQLYTKVLIIYFSFGLTINALLPLLDYKDCNERRLSEYYRIHDPCGMPTRTWVPFEVKNSALYYFLLALNTNACIQISYTVLNITMTLIGLLVHITAQIKNLRQQLLNVFKTQYEEVEFISKKVQTDMEEKLKFCAKYHITIIRFTNEVFDAYSLILIVHVGLTSIIFGIICYQIVAVDAFIDKFRYFLHLMGWVGMLFLTCYYGQLILNESTTIADAVYQSGWYNSPIRLRRIICLIIMRSQTALQLRAASIGVISLETFVSVIKTAYSYFALLLSIAE